MSEGELTPEQLDRQHLIQKEAARRAREEEALERRRRNLDEKNAVQLTKDREKNYKELGKPSMGNLPHLDAERKMGTIIPPALSETAKFSPLKRLPSSK